MIRTILAIGMVVSICATALGQSAIDWHTIDGGGVMSSTGGGFELSGTIGQPDAASHPALTGGVFELTGGFWPVASVCFCPGDINQDGPKNGGDVQVFVNCVLSAGLCSCADIDGMGGITPADTAAFVADLVSGATCP